MSKHSVWSNLLLICALVTLVIGAYSMVATPAFLGPTNQVRVLFIGYFLTLACCVGRDQVWDAVWTAFSFLGVAIAMITVHQWLEQVGLLIALVCGATLMIRMFLNGIAWLTGVSSTSSSASQQ